MAAAAATNRYFDAKKPRAQAKAGDRFQFVRFGYFCKDTKYDNTFNQVVSLKDTFVKK